MTGRAHLSPDPAAVLAKATLRAAELLGVSRQALGRVLGTSEASLSRLAHGRRGLEPASKEGELAALFLRLFRGLDALVGGDGERARAWLAANNRHLGGAPIDRIQTVQGLVHVTEYLDALRGKI